MANNRRGPRNYNPRSNDSDLKTMQPSQQEVEILNNKIEVNNKDSTTNMNDSVTIEETIEYTNVVNENDEEINQISKQIEQDIQEELKKNIDPREENLPEIFISKNRKSKQINEEKNKKQIEDSNKDKPHYVLQKVNGSIEVVNNQKENRVEMSDKRIEMAKKLLEQTEQEIIKNKLEIEIHTIIGAHYVDPNDIANNQRKIDTYNANLALQELRKVALNKIINEVL